MKKTNALIEKLLNRHKLQNITISGVDSEIWLRKLTVGDQAKLYNAYQDSENPLEQSITMIRLSVCDKDGTPVFGSDDEVGKLDSDLAGELMKCINQFNNLDKTAEELEKN